MALIDSVKAVIAMVEPYALSEFDSAGMAELQSLVASAKSPDLKVVLGALVAALKVIGDAEIPKI